MTSTWKNKTSLFEKKYVTRTINGAEWRFYPVSVARLFQLRDTIKSVCTAAAALFGKNSDDFSQQIEKITSGDGEIQRSQTGAIDPALAKLRGQEKRQAIADSIDALLGDQNKLMMGKLLADSLREDFTRNPDDKEIMEFLDTLDLSQLVEMLMGFAEANAKVFGPLGERMRAVIKSKLDELHVAASGEEAQAPSNPAS